MGLAGNLLSLGSGNMGRCARFRVGATRVITIDLAGGDLPKPEPPALQRLALKSARQNHQSCHQMTLLGRLPPPPTVVQTGTIWTSAGQGATGAAAAQRGDARLCDVPVLGAPPRQHPPPVPGQPRGARESARCGPQNIFAQHAGPLHWLSSVEWAVKILA